MPERVGASESEASRSGETGGRGDLKWAPLPRATQHKGWPPYPHQDESPRADVRPENGGVGSVGEPGWEEEKRVQNCGERRSEREMMKA